jgi:hypothetical protein
VIPYGDLGRVVIRLTRAEEIEATREHPFGARMVAALALAPCGSIAKVASCPSLELARDISVVFFLSHVCASSLLNHFLRDGSIGPQGIGAGFMRDPDPSMLVRLRSRLQQVSQSSRSLAGIVARRCGLFAPLSPLLMCGPSADYCRRRNGRYETADITSCRPRRSTLAR